MNESYAEILECLQQAERCKRWGNEVVDYATRAECRDLEIRWRQLATLHGLRQSSGQPALHRIVQVT